MLKIGLSSSSEVPRIFVIGIDGASWNILNVLSENELIPNINDIIRSGYSAKLESTKPPLSIPAWKCYSSGLTPSQLGIHGFLYYDKKLRGVRTITAKDLYRIRDFWEYISLIGKVFVYRHFMSYPVKNIDGFMIADYPIDSKGYHPRWLEREIKSRYGELFYDINFTLNKYDTYTVVIDFIKKDFEVLKYMIKKYNLIFSHFTILHSDGVQHFFWEEWEENVKKNSLENDCIARLWQVIDKNIGEFVDFLSSEYDEFNLIIMSDHGFRRLHAHINMSNIMYSAKLVRFTGAGSLLYFLQHIIPSRIIGHEQILSLIEILIKVINKIKPGSAKWGLQHEIASSYYTALLDFNKSILIPVGGDIYYINNANIILNEIINRIKHALKKHRLDFNDIVDDIIYEKDDNGNIVIKIYSKDYQLSFNVINKNTVIRPSKNKWTGKHDLYGIFISYGDFIKSKKAERTLKIIDLAPTIMFMYNLPIPSRMRGHIIRDMFVNGSKYLSMDVKYVDESSYERIFIGRKIKRSITRIR